MMSILVGILFLDIELRLNTKQKNHPHKTVTKKKGILIFSGRSSYIAKLLYLLFIKKHIHLRVWKMLQILGKVQG